MALDWDKLRVFHTVAVAGSFTRATDVLNISQSAISRQVSILEDSLGVSLFDRLPRGLRLTSDGEKLDAVATHVFGKLAMVKTAIGEEKTLPKGEIEVMVSTALGAMLIAPALKGFLEEYPDIRVSLRLCSENLEVPPEGVDIAILSTPTENSEYFVSHPIRFHTSIYASPSYIEEHGAPQSLADLDHHLLIVTPHRTQGDQIRDWVLTLGAKETRIPHIEIESSLGILQAVRAGIGIGCFYKNMSEEVSDLVELSFDGASFAQERYVVYPKHLGDLTRIRVFADFLIETLKQVEG